MSSGYLLRETGGNLRRNLAMTIAAVVTMFVSLAAAGGVLIMRQAIHEQAVQWQGGVQVAVFLNASVSPGEVRAVGRLLAEDHASGGGDSLVKRYFYVDKAQAYREFKIIFGGDPQLVQIG
ncbi:MAG: permease-like cell division protein FtsX, partial [Actinomycetota bacterium]|nr:permease-like cell division protein FtsX [Actinomycetota bacterium]